MPWSTNGIFPIASTMLNVHVNAGNTEFLALLDTGSHSNIWRRVKS